MDNRSQDGFTLIELLVAIAISGILLGVGVPSFAGAIRDARLGSPAAGIHHALYLARSEALKRSREVTVCARASDATCGTDWDNGWLVFIENAPASITEVVADTSGGEILRIEGPVNAKIDVVAKGTDDRTANGEDDRNWVRYDARALPMGTFLSGFFSFCDDRGKTSALAVNVLLTGDVRTANRNADGAPTDVWSRAVDCT